MDLAETTHDKESFNRVVTLTRNWRGIALVSRTPVEMAGLCYVLVRLRAFDELYGMLQKTICLVACVEGMPKVIDLSCGYYLARAGFLELAAYFILSGILYCMQRSHRAPIWRYQFELWTVKIRLGQWKEAEQWLSSTWEKLSMRAHLQAGSFNVWKQSGDLGEFVQANSCIPSCKLLYRRRPFCGSKEI